MDTHPTNKLLPSHSPEAITYLETNGFIFTKTPDAELWSVKFPEKWGLWATSSDNKNGYIIDPTGKLVIQYYMYVNATYWYAGMDINERPYVLNIHVLEIDKYGIYCIPETSHDKYIGNVNAYYYFQYLGHTQEFLDMIYESVMTLHSHILIEDRVAFEKLVSKPHDAKIKWIDIYSKKIPSIWI